MSTTVARPRPTTPARPGRRPAYHRPTLRHVSQDAGARRALVLLELSQHGPCDVPTLAERCALPAETVAAHLRDLAEAGFVVADGRRWAAVSLVERERARGLPVG
ncbi:hypothetical protein [Cellulomonas iranensis]|uniref:hypothetical protein n=1 Tax=Cellulomonas iranensis TaxID=76862 RepID=UPI0013D29D12|nr:hypothetical protein [Cellulomonas iranensis]